MKMEFKPPGEFSLSSSINWPLWRQKFEIYLMASEKSNSSEQVKMLATLLACIGDDGIHFYNSMSEDDKATLESLLKAFDNHLTPKKVITMETFTFNNMVQKECQSFDEYVRDVRKQAKFCEFTCSNPECNRSYEDRMIKDRLIIGMKDKESQIRLLRETSLTVNKIIDYSKSIELSKLHIKILNPEEDVNAVRQELM